MKEQMNTYAFVFYDDKNQNTKFTANNKEFLEKLGKMIQTLYSEYDGKISTCE